ncbi:MAG: hypothetical protein Q9M36_14195 [Sulfurovum sp.]|nr:hypothetical protein [Sulfurovum sp.]
METIPLEKTSIILNPLLNKKPLAWGLILIALVLSIIENFFKMKFLVGSWHIISYLLVLLPLLYMIGRKHIINPYSKWFVPFLLILIMDMFYYSNDLAQAAILPIVFYSLVFILYMSSMHKVQHLHQVIFIKSFKIGGISYLKAFFIPLFYTHIDKNMSIRILQALAITLPFLVILHSFYLRLIVNILSYLHNY